MEYPVGEGHSMHMRSICCAAIVSALLPCLAFSQAPASAPAAAPSVAAEVQRAYNAVKPNILKSADLMPADAFSYKATPEVRTYARVLTHITEAQFRSCGIANGTTPIAKPPAETADKETIIAALKASFAECDKAYGDTTDSNALTPLQVGPAGKRTRIGLLFGNVSHDNEQYATLALYLRLKGIAPPSSEK